MILQTILPINIPLAFPQTINSITNTLKASKSNINTKKRFAFDRFRSYNIFIDFVIYKKYKNTMFCLEWIFNKLNKYINQFVQKERNFLNNKNK